jgi:hypothetical protein
MAMQWWCSLLRQPVTQATKLSPSTISNKQMGQISSSAGLKQDKLQYASTLNSQNKKIKMIPM